LPAGRSSLALPACRLYIEFPRGQPAPPFPRNFDSVSKVLLISSLAPSVNEQITQHADLDHQVCVQPFALPADERNRLLAEHDCLVLFPGVLDDAAVRAAANLQLIQLVSAGYDRINVKLCRELGIPVANNGGTNSLDVAEHALMLMLSALRRFADFDRFVKAGQWRGIDSGTNTFTLDGKTVGIIGFGNIGRRVAGLLQPFGCHVIFSDAYPPPEEVSAGLGARQVGLEELFAQSDLITIHVPLNDATRNMVNADSLALMKPTAWLVNTCRGEVVDETALHAALERQQIAGAALDVLVREPPPPDHPLLSLDNVIFTPHTAGVTFDSFSRRGEFIFNNINRVARGEEPLALVN